MMRPARRKADGLRYRAVLRHQTDFGGWREAARRLALNDVPHEAVHWTVAGEDAPSLFAAAEPPAAPAGATLAVPPAFPARAETAICHSDAGRFDLLYRLLLRLRAERRLLEIATDPDVARLAAIEKSVRRDIHKMRAFVRFRRVPDAKEERFAAWFEPEHHIVERNADFFVRRFSGMRWTILTPYRSLDWDGTRLAMGPGARRGDAPPDDASEALWKTYFASIFNPARLKVHAMTAEMPKKYWRNLPEAALIPELIAGAERSARAMIERMPTMPAPHHASIQRDFWSRPDTGAASPEERPGTLSALRDAAANCRRCPLYENATQTVFGEGPAEAAVVFVGEQPGDQEDLAGRPFVGPAGRLLDEVLIEAGVDRAVTYVTNAVKHFKYEPRGKKRIHQKPNAGEVGACRWWLEGELALLRPRLAVALGATAAQGLLGKAVPVTKMRGRTVEREDGLAVFITVHPSYLLRLPDAAEKQAERERFLADMRAVRRLMSE